MAYNRRRFLPPSFPTQMPPAGRAVPNTVTGMDRLGRNRNMQQAQTLRRQNNADTQRQANFNRVRQDRMQRTGQFGAGGRRGMQGNGLAQPNLGRSTEAQMPPKRAPGTGPDNRRRRLKK